MTRRHKGRGATPSPGVRYRIASVDAPWKYQNYGMKKHGAAKAHYKEMEVEEICALPVPSIMDPTGSLLFLWCTGPKEAEGAHHRVARAWGYEIVTKAFCWLKCQRACTRCGHDWEDHLQHHWNPPSRCQYSEGRGKQKLTCACSQFGVAVYFGTGNYTGAASEDCWLATKRGSWTPCRNRRRRDVRQGLIHPLPKATPGAPVHSKKPDAFNTRIHWLWPNVPKVELFARDPHPAFDPWGNQVTKGGIVIPSLGGA